MTIVGGLFNLDDAKIGVNTSGIVRKAGAETSCSVLPIRPYVDFFMPNYEEAVMICGLRDRQEILRYFLDRGVKHAVLRMGANGSAIGMIEGEVLREIRTPAFDVPIVDSTGCGDAYNAGFIKGLHSAGI